MIKLMDRQLVLSYFKAYFVCVSSLLGLYVVVDLFTNLDDFTGKHKGLAEVARHIGTYYGYRVTQIFDRLCEATALLAAMFTVTLMQRNNEQMPLLSAGISTHRIVRPVWVCACLMLTLTTLNQELIIPNVADQLTRDKDDQEGTKELTVKGQYEPNGIHIEADKAMRQSKTVRNFRVVIPEALAGNLVHLQAKEAHYIEEEKGWELIGAQPAEMESWDPKVLEQRDIGRYFLHVREVDFNALTRPNNWFQLASTHQLYEELRKPDSNKLAAMAVVFHFRLTRPLLGLLLVFMGLSVILRDTNRNMIISVGSCLVICAIFFLVCHTSRMMGENEFLTPAMAAWLPVLLFGPPALAMFDAVQT